MKLMHILLEAEEEKKVDAVVSQLKSQMGDLIGDIEDTLEDSADQKNEGILTVVGIGLALPAIMGLVAKFGKLASGVINKIIGKKPTAKEEEEDWFNQLGKIADDLHHLYIAGLEKVVAKFVKDPAKSKKAANIIFHVIVAVMLIASGAAAVKAFQSKQISFATLEGVLAAIKGGELKAFISKTLT